MAMKTQKTNMASVQLEPLPLERKDENSILFYFTSKVFPKSIHIISRVCWLVIICCC